MLIIGEESGHLILVAENTDAQYCTSKKTLDQLLILKTIVDKQILQ